MVVLMVFHSIQTEYQHLLRVLISAITYIKMSNLLSINQSKKNQWQEKYAIYLYLWFVI